MESYILAVAIIQGSMLRPYRLGMCVICNLFNLTAAKQLALQCQLLCSTLSHQNLHNCDVIPTCYYQLPLLT